MKSLKFNRLLLLSDSTKSANLFEFRKGYNLVTGKDNSIGKSTLVKSLLWTLGCEPSFDDTWKALDCKALVEFSIGSDTYSVYRYHKTIKVSKNGAGYIKYPKITGDFSERFADIVSFHALLPNKPPANEEPELETPPPAYYFLPFYIDQIKGWGRSWDTLNNLGQYERWQQTIIKYHTGYLPPRHFEIEEEVYEFKKIKERADNEVRRIDTALAVVEEYIPQTALTIDEKELEEITEEVREKLGKLAAEQETVLDKMATYTSDVYYLRNQLHLIQSAINETDKDYVFSVENVDGEDIECPVCGTHHSNTIIDKAGILADKAQLEKQAKKVASELKATEGVLKEASERLNKLRRDIQGINEKYAVNDSNGDKRSFSNIVDSLASKAVQKNVTETKGVKQLDSKKAQDKQKELKKEQSKLLTKDQKKERDEHFTSTLAQYVELLEAQGINLSGVKSPLNHGKLIANGGAAESTRAILAYQMTVLDMAHRFGSSVLSPFIIDTPNQHEQAKVNYESIIKLILEKAPKEQQIFLCALESPMISPYKKKAHVIELDEESKLLKAGLYNKVRNELDPAIKA